MNEPTIPFWLVWNPNGQSPKHRHTSESFAEAEAKRLASENPGKPFYVLAPITEVVKSGMVIRRFNRDDISF